MNILFINNRMAYKRPDGYFYISKKPGELVYELLELGHKIIFFQSYENVNFDEELFSDYKLPKTNNIEYVMISREKYRLKLLIYIALYLKAILSAAKKSDFIYIFYPDKMAPVALLCKYIYNKPYGLYVRGSIGIYNCLSKLLYKKSSLCCTVSPLISEYISHFQKHGIVKTISPMISFTLKDSNKEFRKTSRDRHKILFVGRLSLDKGIRELLDAIILLKDKNVELHLLGDGPMYNEINNFIIENDLVEYVFVHGQISSNEMIEQFYIEADLLCLPSYHEGFPRVLYEAMIFRLPIVTTFVGTIPYLMKHEFNCLEIKTKDHISIYNVCLKLLSDRKLQDKLKENAYKTVESYLQTNPLSHLEIIKTYLNEFHR